jgi:deazaflavin-dependent oxidoreductase (nitroreductase family)
MTDEPQFLYLTTTGRTSGLPREIEIWFTHLGERYYVIAELGAAAGWVKNLRAQPAVRIRVGGLQMNGRARVPDPVAEAALVATVRERSEAKYGWGDGLIVEISPDGASAR